ncbi:7207_t:CDS:1 [Cetraspora pellucida]|uniref:7207_t:CDS:1 n=1 Tax=Cetraspora pellucida TaxID=1433469 RepID=A0A9N9AP09_9GLOM|nr:7207_t:CDS:1 [Cetraspora pellucida]
MEKKKILKNNILISVNKAWKVRATDNTLWKNQCTLAGFPTTTTPSSFNYNIESDDFFYQLYKHHYIVQNNWNKKLFTKHLFLGHRESITCIVGSELSNIFYSASFDKTIKVWEISSQTCLKTLEGHTEGVQCLALAQSTLASGSWDKSIIVYDLTDDYNIIRKLFGHTAGIISIEINSNETLLFSGSVDKTIRIWNINTGDCLHRLYGHDGTVGTLTLIPQSPFTDDQDNLYWLISGSNDTKIFVWDVDQSCLTQKTRSKKPQIVKRLEGHARAVTCLAWHKDIINQIIDHNQRHLDYSDPIHISTMPLLSSSSSSSSPQSNNEDNENDMDLDSHASPSNSCDQDNNDQDTNNVHENDSQDFHNSFHSRNSLLSTNTNNTVPSPPLSPNSDSMQLNDSEKPSITQPIFSASADSTIRMWDLSNGKQLLYANDHTDVVWQIQCNSSRLVSVSSDGFVRTRKWRCNHNHNENQQTGFDSLIIPGIKKCFKLSCPAITLTQVDRGVTCFKMTHEWLVCGTEDGVLIALKFVESQN